MRLKHARSPIYGFSAMSPSNDKQQGNVKTSKVKNFSCLSRNFDLASFAWCSPGDAALAHTPCAARYATWRSDRRFSFKADWVSWEKGRENYTSEEETKAGFTSLKEASSVAHLSLEASVRLTRSRTEEKKISRSENWTQTKLMRELILTAALCPHMTCG